MYELGMYEQTTSEDWETKGEHVMLSDDVIQQLAARQESVRYAAVESVSLASFVRGVRQI